MADLKPGQKMILAFTGGLLTSTSPVWAALVYVCFAILFLLETRRKLIPVVRCLAIASLLLPVYISGSLFSMDTAVSERLLHGLSSAIPVMSAVFFVLSVTHGISPAEIETGILSVLSPLPLVPAKSIAFMAALSYRFFLEGLSLWNTHRELLRVRKSRNAGISSLLVSLTLSPLITLLHRADRLSEAWLFRYEPAQKQEKDKLVLHPVFLLILSFLFAIKIVTIYTV